MAGSRPIARAFRDGPWPVVIAAAPAASAAALGWCALRAQRNPDLTLWAAAVCFAVYTPVLLWLARAGHPAQRAGLCLFGLTFPLWGPVLGVLTAPAGGIVGWPHGVLTGLLIGLTARSWRPGLAVALVIMPAWILSMALQRLAGAGRFDDFELTVLFWNILTSAALALWALHNRGLDLLDSDARAGLCTGCGYDLRGITPGSACPECGVARASSP